MKSVSKTAILPVVSVICIAIAAITGHKFNEGTVDTIATVSSIVITAGISIWGVLKNHKKEEVK
jgi:hypothetical protein